MTPNVSVVTNRQGHDERARLLRRVLDAFRLEDDKATDRVIRRRVEGAVIASELAAGEPAPRLAAQPEQQNSRDPVTDPPSGEETRRAC